MKTATRCVEAQVVCSRNYF